MKKVDIIIPTFEQEDYTVQCLKSIEKHTDKKLYRIIWVDNGSSRESRITVLNELQNHDYLTVWLEKRSGFVVAVNQGIKACEGKYVVVLNNDTEVTNNWLEKLLYPFSQDKKIMITGPNTTEKTSKQSWDIISKKDERFINMPILTDKDDDEINFLLEKQYDKQYYDMPMLAFFCAVFRKKIFDEIGVLDEEYQEGYADDVDFSFRTLNAGYKLVYVPSVYIHHYHNVTFLSIYDKKDISNKIHENRRLFKQKNKIESLSDAENRNYYQSIK